MTRPKVVITRRIPAAGFDLVAAACAVTLVAETEPPVRPALLAAVPGAHGVLAVLTERMDAELMDKAGPDLAVISNFAVGYDNVDVAAATARGILVTNTPGVLTEATADLAMALLLATARRVVESDRYVREGRFQWWGPMLLLGADLYGRTLGILGLGRIGQAVARRARGFGLRILYWNRRRLDAATEAELAATYVPLADLLAQSDFVSVHVPLAAATRHLIGAPEFRRMPPHAILVNTARGPIIDEAALVEALRTGQIAGAGLDVYEAEPMVQPGLLDLPNVVLLPHVGSATHATRGRMAELAARNLLAVLHGQRPAHLINPEVLARPECRLGSIS